MAELGEQDQAVGEAASPEAAEAAAAEREGKDHRAYVGPAEQYDFMGATQFRLATSLGLREEHRVLDIGCGSLRAGKFLIQYLLPDRYHGIEPNPWLIEEARRTEIGEDIFRIKRPRFDHNAEFAMAGFGTSFDMIIAQSIFSHTSQAQFERGLANAAAVLEPEGQFLFTAMSEGSRRFKKLRKGSEVEGWVYPGTVSFPEKDILRMAAAAGLSVQRLPWFHPRQVWYRAVRDKGLRLSRRQLRRMDRGTVLFDRAVRGQAVTGAVRGGGGAGDEPASRRAGDAESGGAGGGAAGGAAGAGGAGGWRPRRSGRWPIWPGCRCGARRSWRGGPGPAIRWRGWVGR